MSPIIRLHVLCQITEWRQLWLGAEGPSAASSVGAGLCRAMYKMWGAQLMPLICMQMCTFLKKWTSARDKFRALAFMNLLKSVMYVKHIIYNIVRLSTFWWCLKAEVSLLKTLLELKFENRSIFAMRGLLQKTCFYQSIICLLHLQVLFVQFYSQQIQKHLIEIENTQSEFLAF